MTRRVLVVEDEPNLRRLLADALKKEGFTVDEAKPAPEPKPVHVSKSLCKKALQSMFGPTAYLQTLHEGSAVVGMRAVAKSHGQLVELVQIRVKTGMALEPDHVRELPFHTVLTAGQAFEFDVRRGTDSKGNPEITWRRIPPPISVALPDGDPADKSIRLAEEAASALSAEIERRGLNLAEPCTGCDKCGPDDPPCLAWGQWAVGALGLALQPEVAPPLKSDADVQAAPASIPEAVKNCADGSDMVGCCALPADHTGPCK